MMYMYTHVHGCSATSVMSNSLRPHGLCSLPGSSVHGILQARILEWVVVPSSKGTSQPRDRTLVLYVSCIGRRNLLPLAPAGKSCICMYPYICTNSNIKTVYTIMLTLSVAFFSIYLLRLFSFFLLIMHYFYKQKKC